MHTYTQTYTHTYIYIYIYIDFEAGTTAGAKHYMLARRAVIPLPLSEPANSSISSCFFAANTPIMALYPQTTCFYPGRVVERPLNERETYTIEFKDDEDIDGRLQQHQIPQRFVIAIPKSSKFNPVKEKN